MGCASSTASARDQQHFVTYSAPEQGAVVFRKSPKSRQEPSGSGSTVSTAVSGDLDDFDEETMFAAKARLKRISAKRRSVKTQKAEASQKHSDFLEEVKVDDAEELENEQNRHSHHRQNRDRAPSVGSVASGGSTDGVWNSKLAVMRKLYSWDDIPMEFFVDKFVDDASTRDGAKKLRPRLSIAKQSRPKSIRHRLSVSRSKAKSLEMDGEDDDEEEDSADTNNEKQD